MHDKMRPKTGTPAFLAICSDIRGVEHEADAICSRTKRRIFVAERRDRRKRGRQQHARNARGLDRSSASIEAGRSSCSVAGSVKSTTNSDERHARRMAEVSTGWKRTSPAVEYRLPQAFVGSEERYVLAMLLLAGNSLFVPALEPHIFIYACS
jgi:hypothetical protein